MPLDAFVEKPALRMEIVGKPDEIPPVQAEVQKEIDAAEGTLLADGIDRAFRLLRPRKKSLLRHPDRRTALLRLLRLQEGRHPARRGLSGNPPDGNAKRGVAILGVFVADVAFRAGRQPEIGETIIGSGFKLGPGGKGSNQSVAAARVGADVTFISQNRQGRVRRDRARDLEEGRGHAAGDRDAGPADRRRLYLRERQDRRQRHHRRARAPVARSRRATSIQWPTRSRARRCSSRSSNSRWHPPSAGWRSPRTPASSPCSIPPRRFRSTMRSTRSATTSPRTRTRPAS